MPGGGRQLLLFVGVLLVAVCFMTAATHAHSLYPPQSRRPSPSRRHAPTTTTTRDTTSCSKITCVSQGQYCGGGNNTVPVCIGTSVCSDDTNDCITGKTTGQQCDRFSDGLNDCISTTCYNGYCNDNYYPGTPCTDDNNCYLRPNYSTNVIVSQCTSGRCYGFSEGEACSANSNIQCLLPLVCSTTGTCIQPQNKGMNCTENTQCIQSLVCRSGICTDPLPSGSSCSIYTDTANCAGTTLCTPTSPPSTPYANTTGKCMEAFTQSAGGYCNTNENCAEGLACDYVIQVSYVGTCIQVATTSTLVNCTLNNNSPCASGETCHCNYIEGENMCILEALPNVQGAKGFYQDYISCTSQCLRSDYDCITSKCQQQYCNQFYHPSYDTISAAYFPACDAGSDIGLAGYFTCSSVTSTIGSTTSTSTSASTTSHPSSSGTSVTFDTLAIVFTLCFSFLL